MITPNHRVCNLQQHRSTCSVASRISFQKDPFPRSKLMTALYLDILDAYPLPPEDSPRKCRDRLITMVKNGKKSFEK